MKFANAIFASAVLFVAVTIPNARARQLDSDAIQNLNCTSKTIKFEQHDLDVAQLKICGGIGKPITQCLGAPTRTSGVSNNVRFVLSPVRKGDVIVVTKGRFEAGVFAALAKCGRSPFSGVILKGTMSADRKNSGDLKVRLVKNKGDGAQGDDDDDDDEYGHGNNDHDDDDDDDEYGHGNNNHNGDEAHEY